MTGIESSRATLSVEEVKPYVENRQAKQLDGICVRRYCKVTASDDSDYCTQHRDEQRAYNTAYVARRRAEWDKAKLCTRCGGDRARDSQWCPRCRTALGKLGRAAVKSHVENRGERIAARLIPWKNSPTNANRIRMRGGDRGRQPIIAEDRFDLAEARACIEHAEAGLAYFWSDEIQKLPRSQNSKVRAAALAKLEQCARWLEEVFVRNGPKRVAKPDGE